MQQSTAGRVVQVLGTWQEHRTALRLSSIVCTLHARGLSEAGWCRAEADALRGDMEVLNRDNQQLTGIVALACP